MVGGGGYWSSVAEEDTRLNNEVEEDANVVKEHDSSVKNKGFNYGVGQGGVLLASSIIDLTPALIEKSMGGTSFLEQDMIVSVSTTSTIANGVDIKNKKRGYNDDPSVSVVLGGGVAIASFSLPKASRPEDGSSSTSWWRIASEPYLLPLSYLASKIRSDFGGNNLSSTAPIVSKGKNQPAAAVGHSGSVGHGFGDILDIAFLSGYTEPTLLILHSNPKRGGGRQWVGRMGRTEEIPVTVTESDKKAVVDDSDDDEEMEEEDNKPPPDTMATGTKYGLTLTAVSLAIHQHRSVVLWSLTDAIPADAWKLIPHPINGVIVLGVNTIVYVGMGGKIQSALAVNGFAKIGCPIGLIPPSTSSTLVRNLNSVHIEANPTPLPLLALQLDGARVGFVSDNVALVLLGNGSLHSLQLHSGGTRMFMSLSPTGNRVGGLGVASCLSILAMGFHASSVERYLQNSAANTNGVGPKKEEENPSEEKEELSGPDIASKGLIFAGSRMGDCTLLAFAMNEPTRLIVTDVDASENENGKRKLDDANPDSAGSMVEHTQKQLKTNDSEAVETLDNDDNQRELSKEDILRMEEEELYRDDTAGVDTTAPSLVSPSRTESDESDEKDGIATSTPVDRKSLQFLTTFRTITALDSLTGLGPLGKC
jgi:cleavage and polyadenylation specificity factor subunit 1